MLEINLLFDRSGAYRFYVNHILNEEKRQLFDTVFSETECPTNLGLTQEDVFGLFDLDNLTRRNAA